MIAELKDKKTVKREQILAAATSLFAKENYHRVMVEDVAKEASIAKGTVYNYFTSKEELYFAVMHYYLTALITKIKEGIQGEFNGIDSLKTFTSILFDFMTGNREFFLIYRKEGLVAESVHCSEIIRLKKELRVILINIITSGKKEKLFEINESSIADPVFGAVYGAVQSAVENHYDPSTREILKKDLINFLLYGLFTLKNNSSYPLKGKTIVLTRTVDQSKESAEIFIHLGADVIIFPTLDIVPPDSWIEFDNMINRRDEIDFIIFTSAHSVNMFLKRCAELNISFNFSGKKIVAVGNKTASVCESLGVPVHIIPKKFSGEGVVDELSNYKIKNKTIFIPRSAIGRDDLPSGLEELGAVLITAPVYNISLPARESVQRSLKKLELNKPDIFIFTSPSTFKNYLEIVKPEDAAHYFADYIIAAIGPTTRSAIESKDVKVDIIPDEFTMEGLSGAIVDFYKKNNRRNN